MDIKILVRKGVSEALMFLSEADGNRVSGEELREKNEISRKRLGPLVDEGILDKSEERVLVRTVPIKRRMATYNISDKGRRLLEICEGLSEEEDQGLPEGFAEPIGCV